MSGTRLTSPMTSNTTKLLLLLNILTTLFLFTNDDESGVVNLKPQATANMDWILGWEILGFKKLYILDDWKGPLASGESNRVDRIDVSRISFYPWEWEPVQNMPNQITASAHTCVLGGKFYCLGGGHSSQKVESVRKSQLAMTYYLSLKAGSSPPPPPCLDLDKILSAFKEVHKPYLPSQNLELEGQSPELRKRALRSQTIVLSNRSGNLKAVPFGKNHLHALL
ncbi:hypothetical protein HYC85_013475 [Camellia sinensis]|uniref:Uncharacterized protein n=1 Tax=Camellia sinensis TaxID=4442 RepID=A0A7J7H710_CAMSI|nr:hypothetical protein HYC85_013475 [Camellia sinensis]